MGTRLARYWGGIFLELTPVVTAATIWILIRTTVRWKNALWQDRFLLGVGVPVVVFFGIVALLRHGRAYWSIPGATSLILATSAFALRKGGWLKNLHLITLALLGVTAAAIPVAMFALPGDRRAAHRLLASEIRRQSPAFLIGHDYHYASLMAYYARPLPVADFTAVGKPAKMFQHWWHGEAFRGKDALVLYQKEDYPADVESVRRHFESLGEPFLVGTTDPLGRTKENVLILARSYVPR
ncbi:MAG: hypothetical protein HY716_06360 [Planctomycetes bacterium]|nr:hypothetical protein [Planctomycetota bacterium]